jgi:hypothetical protein
MKKPPISQQTTAQAQNAEFSNSVSWIDRAEHFTSIFFGASLRAGCAHVGQNIPPHEEKERTARNTRRLKLI